MCFFYILDSYGMFKTQCFDSSESKLFRAEGLSLPNVMLNIETLSRYKT